MSLNVVLDGELVLGPRAANYHPIISEHCSLVIFEYYNVIV